MSSLRRLVLIALAPWLFHCAQLALDEEGGSEGGFHDAPLVGVLGQKPWDRGGISATWTDVRTSLLYVVSKDRYWVQDLSDPDYTQWRWTLKGTLAELLPSTSPSAAPWSKYAEGVTTAYGGISPQDKWLVFIAKDRYWILDTPNADPSTWKTTATWTSKDQPLSAIWSAIPGSGFKPWQGEGVKAAWLDGGGKFHLVAKKTSGTQRHRYFSHDGQTWTDNDVAYSARFPGAPVFAQQTPYTDSAGITAAYAWGGAFGIVVKDKLWHYVPGSGWSQSSTLPGYAQDLWSKAPYLCDSWTRPCLDERFSLLADKLGTVVNAQGFTAIDTLPGETVWYKNGSVWTSFQTVAQADAITGYSPERVAEYRGRLYCGNPPGMVNGSTITWPPTSLDLDAWAKFRACMASSHLVFAWYYIHRHEQTPSNALLTKVKAHLYMLTVHIDAVTTGFAPGGAGHQMLSQAPGSNTNTNREYPTAAMNRLAERGHVQRYLADSNGWFLGLSWAKHQGHLPSTYCTDVESLDGNCITIALHDRVKKLNSAAAARIGGAWMFPTGATQNTQRRWQYYDANAWWAYIEQTPQPSKYGYVVAPNKNDALALTDLAGRTHRLSTMADQALFPHAWNWMASGMATTAKLSGPSPGSVFDDIYAFGRDATAFAFAMDHTYVHPSQADYTLPGPNGYRHRGPTAWCDGALTWPSSDPMRVCEGGTREWYQYSLRNEGDPGVVGMTYSLQHVGGILGVQGWGAPPSYHVQNAQASYRTFLGTFTKDGYPFVDQSGGFSPYAVTHYYQLLACGAPGDSFRRQNSSSRIVMSTGETAGELIATAAPPLAHVISYGAFGQDHQKAHEVLDTLDYGVHGLIQSPLTIADAQCGATPTTNLARKMWQLANLYVSRAFLQRLPAPAF